MAPKSVTLHNLKRRNVRLFRITSTEFGSFGALHYVKVVEDCGNNVHSEPL